ncbi:MAG: PIN domain-containing protein [Thermoanaerobaculia bacterium]
MPAWLLESVALIDWFCGRSGVAPYFDEILEGTSDGAFSTVTEFELWQGLRSGEEADHEAMLSLLERVPLDRAIARRAGELRREVGLGSLSLPDAAIAASAELTGRTLLTRNTRDFQRLKDRLSLQFYDKG